MSNQYIMCQYKCIEAPAKLNLNLFVTGEKANGLHSLKSNVCFLELIDLIYLKYSISHSFYQTTRNSSFIIDNNNNLITKTIDLFKNYTSWDQNFEVVLTKNIPIGGGLGGGSANAAATLILLRNFFNHNKDKEYQINKSALFKLAVILGSDVPACLESRGLFLQGYGEKLSKFKIPNNYYFLLINPNFKLSTKEVFNQYNNNQSLNSKTDYFFENIPIYNSLLNAATYLEPSILLILSTLTKANNIVASGMTGSGSTCFGIYKSLSDIKTFLKTYSIITDRNYFVWYGRKKDYNFNRITNSKVLENKF